MDAPMRDALIVERCTDGKTFVEIRKENSKITSFLNDDYRMADCLRNKRNKAGVALMAQLKQEHDPNNAGQDEEDASLPKRRKQDMIDECPSTVDVTAVTKNGVAITMTVRASWRCRDVLSIEMLKENLEVLLEEPEEDALGDAYEQGFTPTIQEIEGVKVKWFPGKSAVGIMWHDNTKGKKRLKSKKIHRAAPAVMQESVDQACEELVQFYAAHHRQDIAAHADGDAPASDDSGSD